MGAVRVIGFRMLLRIPLVPRDPGPVGPHVVAVRRPRIFQHAAVGADVIVADPLVLRHGAPALAVVPLVIGKLNPVIFHQVAVGAEDILDAIDRVHAAAVIVAAVALVPPAAVITPPVAGESGTGKCRRKKPVPCPELPITPEQVKGCCRGSDTAYEIQ